MKRVRWWHGVLFFGAVRAVAWGLRAPLGPNDPAFYERQRLPKWAPPAIAFPIAWSINSLCATAGLLHVLNLSRAVPGRCAYLRSQGAAWLLFAIFDAAYFGLRSPINAAAVTALYTAATAYSLYTAAVTMRDSKAAWALASTAAWLLLANPLAAAQVALNPDEFWNGKPRS
jgi:translocator protein